MIIRKAIRSDVKEIAKNNVQLAEETESRSISKITAEQGTSAALSKERNGWYLVAEHNHAIIGQLFVTDEWSDWRNQCIWWIHRVYVQKSWRKKGVFTNLFNELKQKAMHENVYALRLYDLEKNKKAVSIYKKMGFTNTSFLILKKR